jgi:hypothetical protein
MKLSEALTALRRDPSDEEAGAVLVERSRALAGRSSVVREYRDQARDDSCLRLLQKLADPSWDLPRRADAYLGTMIRNRSLDLWRRADTARKKGERIRAETEALAASQAPDEVDFDEECVDLLDRSFDLALRQRTERHRPPLQRAWRQILAIKTRAASVIDLLLEEGQEATKKDLDRAYKAHQRAREAVERAIGFLEFTGKLSREDAEVARICLGHLIRCQVHRRTASPG